MNKGYSYIEKLGNTGSAAAPLSLTKRRRAPSASFVVFLITTNGSFAFEDAKVVVEYIKNLENVQGDERDVILISMTYGPDQTTGVPKMSFGPINRDLGWRRLNVLFTRAKNRMHIFSSLGSSDIKITPTSKRGLIAYRDFLEYCETGHLHQPKITGRSPDSDFEISVIKAMEARGYECEPQLGVAGFFLDIAVRDPKKGISKIWKISEICKIRKISEICEISKIS